MNKELLLEYAAELAKTNATIETYYKQYLLREKNLFDAILQIIVDDEAKAAEDEAKAAKDEAKAAKEYEKARKEYERIRSIKQTLVESAAEQIKAETAAIRPINRDYKTYYILPPQAGGTCQKCSRALQRSETPIYVYRDSISDKPIRSTRVDILYCTTCKTIYIQPNILDTLEHTTGIANTNIRAIQVSNTGATCRWFKCQNTDIYRDGLCQYHYNEEHANSK